MTILMAGIDYNHASLELREHFSFTTDELDGAYAKLREMPDIAGAVIVATCNRTELYIYAEHRIDVFELLCVLAGADCNACSGYRLEGGIEVMRHLCALGSGVMSQIWGEDQILAQVKDSLTVARKNHSGCNVLEVMFRDAIAAAKKIKTEIKLGVRKNSIVSKAMDTIRTHNGVHRALVIGNGEIGRLMTSALVENGFHATMTLRSYRHGETAVPAGAHTIDYEKRYEALPDCDVLISATRSPHRTIDFSVVRELSVYPKLWLDLAVPRDIGPEIASLPGVVCLDVDSLSKEDAFEGREDKILQVNAVIDRYVSGFEKWLEYQSRLNGDSKKQDYFPMFVAAKGKKVLIAGGGRIASRRAVVLSQFAFELTVVAPGASAELEKMSADGRLTLIRREFRDEDLSGCFMVVAATDDRGVNRYIGELAAKQGIPASVADSRDECGFLFPAIAISGDVVAGITSGGKSHYAAAEAARKIREVLQL